MTAVQIIKKEKILSTLQETSNDIQNSYWKEYGKDLDQIFEEISYSYDIIYQIINREDQKNISDADFQSALLFWTSLNTILSSIKLFMCGYSKEPQMLIRNAVESFSAAYDIHANPEKYETLQKDPEKFNSTNSISVAKNIHPFIGQMYGMLSDHFTHVGILHSLPHKSDTPLCIGGIYDPKEIKYSIFSLSILITAVDTISSIIEFTFFNKINTHRRWTIKDSKTLHFTPDLNGHAMDVADRLKILLDKME